MKVYLVIGQKNKKCILNKREKYLKYWFRENKEIFANCFMVIADISYKIKLKIRKGGKVKIKSDNCEKYVLTPVFKEDFPSLNPNNLYYVKHHQDKVVNYISKSTTFYKIIYKT